MQSVLEDGGSSAGRGPASKASKKNGRSKTKKMREIRDRADISGTSNTDIEVREDPEFKVRLEFFILGAIMGLLFGILVSLMRTLAYQEYIHEFENDPFDGYYVDYQPSRWVDTPGYFEKIGSSIPVEETENE